MELDFLEREDCKEYKEFDIFVSEQYKTISCRTMDMEPDYTGDNISFFENVKKNSSIRKFCRMIDNLDGKEVNMFEIFDMYRSVYECVWCRGNKHHIKELIIYDAVRSFFLYSETKRKQVKFFDFLIVEIMKKYVMGHKKLDVTEMFPHDDLLPCPFCGCKAGFIKKNSSKGRDGKRDPEGIKIIKIIKVVCSKHCFSASHFGTPERIPDKDTIGYMAYRWNQRYYSGTGSRDSA